MGIATPLFIPLLNHFMLELVAQPELRLAAVQAFRRFPCSADVSRRRNTSHSSFYWQIDN